MISMFAQMGKQRAVTFDLSTYLTFFFLETLLGNYHVHYKSIHRYQNLHNRYI